jgi:ParB family chromosome partitioning protein
MWAAGRLGAAPKELMSAATSHTHDRYFRPIRLEAIRALANGKASKAILEVLEAAALGHDPEVRAVAAQVLAEQDAERAEALARKMIADRVSLDRLAIAENLDITEALHSAAENAHSQGVALPLLIAAGELEQLKTVAHNQDLSEAARLGAIEGLALLGQEAAEEELAKLGKNETEDEELRKAAWRARRRSHRLRVQTAGSNS